MHFFSTSIRRRIWSGVRTGASGGGEVVLRGAMRITFGVYDKGHCHMFQTTLKRSTTSGDFAADSVAEKAISLAKFLRFALDSREPRANKPRGPIAQLESGRLRNDASGVRLPLGRSLKGSSALRFSWSCGWG